MFGDFNEPFEIFQTKRLVRFTGLFVHSISQKLIVVQCFQGDNWLEAGFRGFMLQKANLCSASSKPELVLQRDT
jgi:hypothetical protein